MELIKALLVLSVLPVCLGSGLQDLHSLCCNFIVNASTQIGECWIVVNCSVDGMVFLQFDNKSKATPLGHLGKRISATEEWKSLTQWLDTLGQEFRDRLHNWDKTKTSGDSTLLATMISQHNLGQVFDASWQFNLSGKSSFSVDTRRMTWTLINGPRGIMDEWKDDVDLKKHLNNFIVEWSQKLNEFLMQQKEWPESPTKTADTNQPICATQSPATTQTTTQLASATENPTAVNSTQLSSATEVPWTNILGWSLGATVVLGVITVVVCCVCGWQRNRLGSHSWCWEALSGLGCACCSRLSTAGNCLLRELRNGVNRLMPDAEAGSLPVGRHSRAQRERKEGCERDAWRSQSEEEEKATTALVLDGCGS